MKPTKKFEKVVNEEAKEKDAAEFKTQEPVTASAALENRDVILTKINHLIKEAYQATEPLHTKN